MRNDRVLTLVLLWHTILNDCPLVYTRIFIDNYPKTLFYHKMPTFGLFEQKKRAGLWVQSKTGHS